jgi:molybdenum cofactor synthesis domain-containing protein
MFMLEIICVGNELLIGKTLNTNAHWLAKHVTSLGLTVRRITVTRDEVDEIASVLREALKRKPRFIITTGGLGPTFDDKTLEGIARGLNLKLHVNQKALDMVKEKYESYLKQGHIDRVELTPARVKMATLPERAEPLPNGVGTAPGILLRVDTTSIIALPGVPPEMEAIFEESVVPLIRKEAGKSGFFERSIYTDRIMESTLAPLIDQAMRDNPRVYIKSHVYTEGTQQSSEGKPHIEVHFSTVAHTSKNASKRLDKAIASLSKLIEDHGGRVKAAQDS